MKDLDGKVAVVTGGRSGIGRATGRVLTRQGIGVVLAARTGTALAEVVAECREESLDVMDVETDVADFESMSRPAAAAYEAHGDHPVLVVGYVVEQRAGHRRCRRKPAWT